jgi:hypothetical protein
MLRHFAQTQLIKCHLALGLYHPLDGVTNLEYNLLCFLTLNKIIFSKQKTVAFNGIDAAI